MDQHGQPTDGTEAALAQRVAAFMSDDSSSRGVAGDESQSEGTVVWDRSLSALAIGSA